MKENKEGRCAAQDGWQPVKLRCDLQPWWWFGSARVLSVPISKRNCLQKCKWLTASLSLGRQCNVMQRCWMCNEICSVMELHPSACCPSGWDPGAAVLKAVPVCTHCGVFLRLNHLLSSPATHLTSKLIHCLQIAGSRAFFPLSGLLHGWGMAGLSQESTNVISFILDL